MHLTWRNQLFFHMKKLFHQPMGSQMQIYLAMDHMDLCIMEFLGTRFAGYLLKKSLAIC